MELSKPMPCCEEAEKVVLGTIMTDRNALAEVRELLTVEAFYFQKYREIYAACLKVADRGEETDIVTVMNQLRSEKSSVTPYEITSLSGCYSPSVYQHAAIIFDKYKRRQFFEIGAYLQNNCFSEENDIIDVFDAAKQKMDGMFTESDNSIFTMKDAIQGVYDNINKNMAGGSGLTGYPTGFSQFDRRSGGLQTSDLIIVAADSSQGKALPMDAKILTPNGWVKNKDIKLGQEVCSIDGEKSYVTGVFYKGVKPMYKIRFSDGREVVCCKEHLWEVTSGGFKSGNRILNTEQIKEYQDNSVLYHNHMGVPDFSGNFGEHKEFIIHPYILGVLLGDGCLTRGAEWCKPDEFILEKIKSLLSSEYYVKRIGKRRVCNYRISTQRGKSNPILTELERLGLRFKRSEEKFIPDEYLSANREQRLQLLQGLMDTDGYIDSAGECVYYSKSEKLMDDVRYLAHSLGYDATKNRKVARYKGIDYVFCHYTVINDKNEHRLFTTPKKAVRMRDRKRLRNVILSVDYVGEMECQCISVSHPRELYITDNFIVTHNTSLAIKIAMTAGCPIAFYSMEMKKEQIAARMMSIESGVPASEILYSRLASSQISALDKGVAKLSDKPIYFDDKSTSNIESILASIRMMKIKYGIKGAIIDYLQILNVNMKGTNKEQQMGDVARRLKNIAKDLDIFVIALSQLSRDRDNPVPSGDRLRDSGQIKEAADTVMLIYRPEVYGKNYPEPFQNTSTKDTAMIDIAKGRNIGLMKFIVGFDGRTTNFYELEQVPVLQTEETPF